MEMILRHLDQFQYCMTIQPIPVRAVDGVIRIFSVGSSRYSLCEAKE